MIRDTVELSKPESSCVSIKSRVNADHTLSIRHPTHLLSDYKAL